MPQINVGDDAGNKNHLLSEKVSHGWWPGWSFPCKTTSQPPIISLNISIITQSVREHERKLLLCRDSSAEKEKLNYSVNFRKCSALPQNCQLQLFLKVITFRSHCGSPPFILVQKRQFGQRGKNIYQSMSGVQFELLAVTAAAGNIIATIIILMILVTNNLVYYPFTIRVVSLHY